MPDILSPYALLKQCKPTPPASYSTPYDLFCAAAQSKTDFDSVNQAPSVFSDHLPSTVPIKRTHYIDSIRARHSHAAMHTEMTCAVQIP